MPELYGSGFLAQSGNPEKSRQKNMGKSAPDMI
jgi:hypothetical protein